jgi:hypothetical protein
VVTRKKNSKPRSRPWSEPPVELEADELLSVRPGAAEELDVGLDVEIVSPPAREAPFSDVTPMWSSLDVSKLASPLFASSAWQPPATESRARAAWRDMQTRATDAVRRHRAWVVGAAIATLGAVGTCALVTAVRSPNAEGANASMVAFRPSEPC